MKTVAIFGVFDGVHEGHKAFIAEAATHGDQLVAIVARDVSVQALKGKLPTHDESTRIKMLLEVPEIDLVYLGDADEGTYKTLQEVSPNLIFLGYDQQGLFDSITKAMSEQIIPTVEVLFGSAYKPEIYHTSIINHDHATTI